MSDSHTGFNSSAFTVVAIGGAGVLASALAAGIANLRRCRENEYMSWTAAALRRALRVSELFRARELEQLQIAVDMIAERDRTIADLQRQIRTDQANRLQLYQQSPVVPVRPVRRATSSA
jgi:hypothetical protein